MIATRAVRTARASDSWRGVMLSKVGSKPTAHRRVEAALHTRRNGELAADVSSTSSSSATPLPPPDTTPLEREEPGRLASASAQRLTLSFLSAEARASSAAGDADDSACTYLPFERLREPRNTFLLLGALADRSRQALRVDTTHMHGTTHMRQSGLRHSVPVEAGTCLHKARTDRMHIGKTW